MCAGKGLIQEIWDPQTLHLPKKGLTLACLLEDNLYALRISYLTSVCFSWGLGPCQIVYANNVIYGVGLGSSDLWRGWK